MEKCNRCNKSFEIYDQLRRHVGVVHKVHATDFYVEYHLNGKWPICKCGCGGKVKWSHQLKGFRKFCQGHQSRVHNNWGHNIAALERSVETRRERFALEEISVWNKGLTINDERVKENVNVLTAFARTTKERKVRSNRMRKHRKDGTIPTLHGSHHSQWNGGTSSVSMLVYNDVRFYEEWKRPILLRDGFKCVECGNIKDLHVHHDIEMLCDIIKKHVGDSIDTSNHELKRSIADAVVDYHIKNKVSGMTLCRGCHGKIHPSLNF